MLERFKVATSDAPVGVIVAESPDWYETMLADICFLAAVTMHEYAQNQRQ
jgi:hypothetical protein